VTTDQRYARLEALPGIGAAGIDELRNARVVVLGAGNIGGQLAQHLVLLGVNLVLVDRDVVAGVNLGTQGFRERDLGRSKAEARAEALAPLNPSCRIEAVHGDIRRLGLGALRDASLLFSCLDSRSSRMLVNEVAVRLGIAWIDGALDGSGATLFGRVACYDPRLSESACYLCPHDSSSLRDISKESGTSKGCSAAWWRQTGETAAPTLATSALGGAVASMQAIWGLKVLLGASKEIAGTEIYFDLGRQRLSTHRLRKNPRCLLDHRTWQLTSLGSDSRRATVAQTFAFAETALKGDVALQLLHRSIVTAIRCPRCGAEKQPHRALDAIEGGECLCACGDEMHPGTADLLDRFERIEARPFLDRTWQEIGVPQADVVVATRGNQELHIVLSE
jgi:molybdopterin/thiamine biosynthesis adenylyltransferase